MRPTIEEAHGETLRAWDENAAYWDQTMGEGNDFVEVLIWPATRRLADVQPGQQVLDIACGNGLYARRLAALGAEVVAFDFAPEMIARARRRSNDHLNRIEYRVLDATDEDALLTLGPGRFDVALCNMALFDMSRIEPLVRALARLLRPDGRFVFSIVHPCFNTPRTTYVAEMQDHDGELVTVYSVKVSHYMTPTHDRTVALAGQPKPQFIFHRPLHVLLGTIFEAGFVLTALEERAFPADHPVSRRKLGWDGRFSEIPPVLIARCVLSQPTGRRSDEARSSSA